MIICRLLALSSRQRRNPSEAARRTNKQKNKRLYGETSHRGNLESFKMYDIFKSVSATSKLNADFSPTRYVSIV